MAYIGQNLDRFSNVEKLDAITPATATGAGPYNLTKGSVAFTPSSADTMVVSINGVVQYGNFTVSGSTITFSGALADADTCDFIYHMGTGLLSTPVDNSVSTVKIVDSNVTNAKLAGSIANDKLSNSAITINGTSISLVSSGTIVAGTDWQAVKTSNFTAAASEGYFVDTTSGAITATLPASPSLGDEVRLLDLAGTFDTNNLTIGRNSKKIQGLDEDLVVSTENAAIGLVFTNDTYGWRLIENL